MNNTLTNEVEGNVLITEFMNVSHCRADQGSFYYINDDAYLAEDLKYHSSFDWLMPVVEKIKDYSPDHEIEITMGKTFCRIFARDLDDGSYLYGIDSTEDKPIDAVYNAIIQFIKWYNNQVNIAKK